MSSKGEKPPISFVPGGTLRDSSFSALNPHTALQSTHVHHYHSSKYTLAAPLVSSRKRWHSFALGLVQRRIDDITVSQINRTLRSLLEGQGMLHPFLIVALWVVFAGVCSAGLFAIGRGNGGLIAVVIGEEMGQ